VAQYGTWNPYTGNEALILAGILLVIGIILLFAGARMRGPVGVLRPGRTVSTFLLLIWLLALATSVIAIVTYGRALLQQQGPLNLPASPISPITTLSALITFMAIVILGQHRGFLRAVGSGIAGTMAGPMIFELPFDLIVMSRTYGPEPAVQFMLLFFLPLFLLEITTLALLTISPLMRLSKYTLFALAAMFIVFAAWAYFGFPYPSSALPFAFNSAAKVLAFAAAITLFLPERD